jgi:hypothetical protein
MLRNVVHIGPTGGVRVVDFFVLILVMVGVGGVRVMDFVVVVADSSHDDDGISATASNFFLNVDFLALYVFELCAGRLRERLSRK